MKSSSEFQDRLESAGLDVMDYDSRNGFYRIRLQPGEVEKHKDILTDVIADAYNASSRD
jgi:hypothetical protein